MDRERLEEYEKLQKGLSFLRKEIRKTENAIRRNNGTTIPDIATGSSPEFPYIRTKVKIESVDLTRHDEYVRKLKKRETEYQNLVVELEDWLEDIQDPLLYTIFKLKLKDGLSDKQIGEELGYCRSRITQLINEHLKD